MAEIITMERLRNVVRLLNTMTDGAYDFGLDGAYGGYRLVRKDGSVDVSPRMKRTELYYWVHAFRDGIMLGLELRK